MDMKLMKDLEHRGCKELDKLFEKKDWGPAEFSIFHQLTGGVKNLKKIEKYEMEAMGGDGYSQAAGTWRANMEGNYGNGHSYANRGQHWVRGHYSRESGNNGQNGYSQGGSLMDMLEEKMRSARTEREREDIRRCMDTVRSMM